MRAPALARSPLAEVQWRWLRVLARLRHSRVIRQASRSRALRKLDDCFQEAIDFDGLGQVHLKPCIQCSLPIVLAGERSQRDGGDLFPSVEIDGLLEAVVELSK